MKKLILINTAGIELDNHSVYTDLGQDTYAKEKFNKMFSKLYYKVPKLPYSFKKFMINKINEDLNFIDNQLGVISDTLSAAETDLQTFRSENEIMDMSFQAQQLYTWH